VQPVSSPSREVHVSHTLFDRQFSSCDPLRGLPSDGVIRWPLRQLHINASIMGTIDRATQSPCVRNCCLDDEGTCLGCFRSLDEIKEWGVTDTQRRLVILRNAEQRRDDWYSRYAKEELK